VKVVLVSPKIPQNTGNIVRTCAAVGAQLVLVRPLGFSVSDRHLKRAGLDYWCHVDVQIWEDLTPLSQEHEIWLFSSKGQRSSADVSYSPQACLVFGSEDEGLPEELLLQNPSQVLRIPMVPGPRCLNLSVSVGIGLFQAWHQLGYAGAERCPPISQPQGTTL
jgi:tRNA (cytidine/uridine-2'-O-)-methyltransferase